MLTKEQAVVLYESKFWEEMSYRERAMFQMFESRLCMPFDVFHEAVEKTLLRPVFTHEFGLNYQGLQDELLGNNEAPSLKDIIGMIPEKQRILVRVK